MVQTSSSPVRSWSQWSRPPFWSWWVKKPLTVVKSPSAPRTDSNSWDKRNDQSVLYVNDKIKAFEVIVIDEEGENLGKMSRYDALGLAKEKWLDLVQLSYNPIDKVCTAKITDVGKYLYEKKKVNKEKKKTANKWMKQMKFAYGIGDNDLNLKIVKVKEMLDEGYTVRVFVQLKWRENIYKEKVIDKLHFVQKELAVVARSQSPEPKQDKNTYSYMFLPIKK